MKLWEVMRLLEENPKKEFEANLKSSGYRVVMSVDNSIGQFYMFDVYEDDLIIGALKNGGSFNGNVSFDLDWKEVKQPVSWQEAIQAWADGKKVSYKYPKDPVTYSFQDSNRMMCIEKIKDATWYVED